MNKRIKWLFVSICTGVFFVWFVFYQSYKTPIFNTTQSVEAGQTQQGSWTALVDDYEPQPLMGETIWFYNRFKGDRGQVDGWWDPNCPCSFPGGGNVLWGQGMVTATITQTQGSEAWVGVWTSLNHPNVEKLPLNFSAVFPEHILPAYQASVSGLHISILNGSGQFVVELKDINQNPIFSQEVTLTGGQQTVSFNNLPTGDIQELTWLVKGQLNDFVIVDKVEIELTTPPLTAEEQAFLWSYGMLLANWDETSGLTRDRASFPAGAFDNVSASGLQAAAAIQAWHLGIISEDSATQIVSQTTAALLSLTPTGCNGLWPHFVTNGQITPGTEWSSVDTIIAMVALVGANEALDLEANVDAVIQDWQAINWNTLVNTPTNTISHGFDFNCTSPLTSTWFDFGTETWLVNFGYAAATGNIANMDTTPPTYNGSGFIDELAWLFFPAPDKDIWGIQWNVYRNTAADAQLTYYQQPPHPCYNPDLFGLSAAEVPDPSTVITPSIYQPFGVGGEIPANDETALLGHAVVVPHYPAMISSLRPQEAIDFWNWMTGQGLFTPLNNVESLMYVDEPGCSDIVWNSLKGSWNLGLQTLGWGNYLLQGDNPLYQAMYANDFLRQAYIFVTCPECIYLPSILKN